MDIQAEKNLRSRQEQKHQSSIFLEDRGGGGGGTVGQNMAPGRWRKNIIFKIQSTRVTQNPEMGMCPGKIGLETFKNTPHFPSGGRGGAIFNSKAESTPKMATITEDCMIRERFILVNPPPK